MDALSTAWGGGMPCSPEGAKKGVGWIAIEHMRVERIITIQEDGTFKREFITISDAQAEGGYSPSEYEVLWDTMYRDADRRLVIEFMWVGE